MLDMTGRTRQAVCPDCWSGRFCACRDMATGRFMREVHEARVRRAETRGWLWVDSTAPDTITADRRRRQWP